MDELEVLARFEDLKQQGDFISAEKMMLDWSCETDRFEDKWLAAGALHTLALSLGLQDKVLEYSRQLVQLDPDDPYAHNCLGLAYKTQGDMARAETELSLAVELAKQCPDDPNVESYVADLRKLLVFRESCS